MVAVERRSLAGQKPPVEPKDIIRQDRTRADIGYVHGFHMLWFALFFSLSRTDVKSRSVFRILSHAAAPPGPGRSQASQDPQPPDKSDTSIEINIGEKDNHQVQKHMPRLRIEHQIKQAATTEPTQAENIYTNKYDDTPRDRLGRTNRKMFPAHDYLTPSQHADKHAESAWLNML